MFMKLKVPPALQFALVAFFMWLINRWVPVKHFDFDHQKLLSWIIFFSGMAIGIWAVLSFKKARTTVDPTQPEKASSLVIKGVYQYSRNPMYLAMLMALLAYAFRTGNLYTFPMLAAYVFYITEFQIKPEEKVLAQLFGPAYELYKTKVRRWI